MSKPLDNNHIQIHEDGDKLVHIGRGWIQRNKNLVVCGHNVRDLLKFNASQGYFWSLKKWRMVVPTCLPSSIYE